MNLVIDIGNTSIKAGLFKKDLLSQSFLVKDKQELYGIVARHNGEIIISNVADQSITGKILTLKPQTMVLSTNIKLPFSIKYKTPHTLGLDRIAACCGAMCVTTLPCLVVDIGTCITLDGLNHNYEFIGGNISPGPALRFKAMNNFTSALPLEELNDESSVLGTSTQEAIQSGVKFGIIHEILGTLKELRSQDSRYQLVLTGGYSSFFDSKLKEDIFAEPNLVLLGLNRILNYNVKK